MATVVDLHFNTAAQDTLAEAFPYYFTDDSGNMTIDAAAGLASTAKGLKCVIATTNGEYGIVQVTKPPTGIVPEQPGPSVLA